MELLEKTRKFIFFLFVSFLMGSAGTTVFWAFPSCVCASGQTYYVATTGSDANVGDEGHPWRTLQHAVESIGPGDTILVQSGTYRGCRIEFSGASTGWKTLKAAPDAHVIVYAPGPSNKHQSNIEIETWEGSGIVAYWTIQNLEVSNAPQWGIDVRGNETSHSHHINILSNNVHDNGLQSGKTGIFTAFVDYLWISNNECYRNGEHGIYLSNSGDYPTVTGNRLHHNTDCGLQMNGDVSMGGDGLIAGGFVEGNIIYENGKGGGAGINLDGVVNTCVCNNLLYNNHAGGIALFQENGAVGSRNNQIYNNTIVMPNDGRWALRISDASCINNHLINNIIITSNPSKGSIVIPVTKLSGFESDYNIVVNRLSADGDAHLLTLEQWKALGYDRHSFISSLEDLFVNPSENDYHLQKESPAIDKGETLANVPHDLDGVSRPIGSGYDIGAYEYLR